MPSRHGRRCRSACLLAALVVAGAAAADESRFTPAQLRQDLDFVASEIRAQHPEPAHSMDAAAFERAVAALRASLTTPLTRDEAWAAFATLNPLFADAHLVVAYPDWRGAAEAHLKAGGGFFPFEVSIAEDGAPVVTALQGGAPTPLAGRRIRSIDGEDARARSTAVLARVHGDTSAFRRELASRRWFLFDWKLSGARPAYEIAFEGEESARRVPAGRATPLFLADEASFERQFAYETLPCGAALLTLSTFAWPDKPQFLDFTREAFRSARVLGVRTLVIDVRANGGGDDDYWIEGVLPYVADEPYRHGSAYRKRVLEKYRDEDETTGELVTGEIDDLFQPEPANALRFDGKVYVLVGRSTYSSAILFSNVMQDYGFGTLAGAAPTARARQSGSTQQSRLPNTGLVLVWPRFVLERPSGIPEPVLLTPEVVVEDDPLRPRAAVEALLRRESAACDAMPASPTANRGP
jgi:hypothetical protein